MDTLPLPAHPSLEQYKKRTKGLVAAASSDEPDALRKWARDWLESLANALDERPTDFVQHSMERAISHIEKRVGAIRSARSVLALADAQSLVAQAHGFETWAAFARHVGAITGTTGPNDVFETAADAVVNGDLPALQALVRERPSLVRARSSRVHRVTLLHYVAANGVEDFRQKTPANAVAIARFLLESGAEVDAAADTYGRDWWQTTMNLLVSSTHPADAGLQSALVDVLADFGAAVNGVRDDESPLMTALDFGYIDAAETLVRRGARLDTAAGAAALGRLDLIQRFVIDAHTVRAGVPLIAPHWKNIPKDPARHIELALVWACKFGRTAIADHLLDLGVDPTAADGNHMTALHWAAASGMTGVVQRLLDLGAPLEAMNDWEGTVLSSTAHFAIHMPVKGVDYPRVLELLIARGAHVNAAYPSGSEWVDALLRRHM